MPTRSLVLLAASLLTGCLAVLVLVQDSDLLLLREHLNHPFALGVLACALMTLGALGLLQQSALDPISGRPRTTASVDC
ncbi:hypothetical protein ABT120_06195 [Nonomuraea angiospora]|uniref:hypothetical protein n=1 Tax=Nonomuraea angiospora TaxID=46172 RepID=UPI0033274FC1